MSIEELIADKSTKTKDKVKVLAEWLSQGTLPMDEMINFADKQKSTNKATCIESIEMATQSKPALAADYVLEFAIKALTEKEPRVKWESAKVIGNIAKIHPKQATEAVANLLNNAKHPGTVVRWASAYALAEILKLNTDINVNLLPQVESLYQSEENNGVKKKYLDALKKLK